LGVIKHRKKLQIRTAKIDKGFEKNLAERSAEGTPNSLEGIISGKTRRNQWETYSQKPPRPPKWAKELGTGGGGKKGHGEQEKLIKGGDLFALNILCGEAEKQTKTCKDGLTRGTTKVSIWYEIKGRLPG